jgi:hypothetical protein
MYLPFCSSGLSSIIPKELEAFRPHATNLEAVARVVDEGCSFRQPATFKEDCPGYPEELQTWSKTCSAADVDAARQGEARFPTCATSS